MKLNHLKITNFRSHGKTDLDLDRITFILGVNASGKSSILMAMEMLLTGKCAVTDAGGRGAEALVRLGEESGQFEIGAELDLGLSAPASIQRIRGVKGHQLNLQGAGVLPLAAAQQKLYNRLATNEDVLSAVLTSTHFLDAAPAEQKKLLAQVMAGGEITIPEEIRKLLNGMRIETLGDIDNAYRVFYGERTNQHRYLREHPNAPKKPSRPEDAVDPKMLKATRQEYEHDRDKLVARRAELKAGMETYEHEERRIEGEMKGMRLAGGVEVGMWEQAVEDEKAYLAGQKLIAELRAEVAGLEARDHSLLDFQAKECPTCGQEVTGDYIEGVVKRLRREATEKQKRLTLIEGEQRNRMEPQEARRLLAEQEKASGRVRVLERQLADLRMPTLEELSRLDEEIERQKGRIENLLEQEQEATARTNELEQWKAASAEWERATRRAAELEKLCEFFGPNGIKAELVAQRSGGFLETLNGYLGGFGFKVRMEEGELLISRGYGAELKVGQLSESERFRFGVAFQIALSEATGLGFVVIDRADVLDEVSRRLLLGMLYDSELEQAIVLSTAKQMPEWASQPPQGVKVYWIEQQAGESHVSGGIADGI